MKLNLDKKGNETKLKIKKTVDGKKPMLKAKQKKKKVKKLYKMKT